MPRRDLAPPRRPSLIPLLRGFGPALPGDAGAPGGSATRGERRYGGGLALLSRSPPLDGLKRSANRDGRAFLCSRPSRLVEAPARDVGRRFQDDDPAASPGARG